MNIIQQSYIKSITSTIILNIQLVGAFQFLQQFKLDICYKPRKEYIIPDTPSRLASANVGQAYLSYLELDTLFAYSTTLIKICLELISKILAGYKANKYWSHLQRQL